MNKRVRWKKIKQRGNLLWSNASSIMRDAGYLYRLNEDGTLSDEIVGEYPRTYTFDGVPAYNTYSALVPVGSKENPHEFAFYDFDEDEGTGEGWQTVHIDHPLRWQTENEFLIKIGEKPNE